MGVLLIWLVTFLILVSSATSNECKSCPHTSNISKDDHINILSGTCQYGNDTTEFNGYYPAGAKPSLYQEGAGCGATYLVKCTEKKCNQKGIKVIVTTILPANERGDDDFVLSEAAFKNLFNKNRTTLKSVPVDYNRVESDYGKNKSMSIRVEDMDPNPYFAMTLLYQGGRTYIKSITILFQGRKENGFPMNRRNGAIWEVKKRIKTNWQLKFNITVTEGSKDKAYETDIVKNLRKWEVHGLGLQLNGKFASETCKTCVD